MSLQAFSIVCCVLVFASTSFITKSSGSSTLARYLLYFATIWGCWHLSLCPIVLVISEAFFMLKCCMGKLIHTVWWLLTITSPKCRNPPLASSNSKCDRKMPAMALLPHWCITNGELPCSDDIASTKCVSQQNFIMSGASTSSFMLARTIISSPSSCYCLISVAKLVSHSFLGHFVCLCNCCWYVVRGPSDLHGL